jgi:hypothetical protein
MSANRAEFSARRKDFTWSVWAVAFEKMGIRSNAAGPVTAHAVKRTWYSVRLHHGEEIAAPVIPAEKAKVKKRRSPRRVVSRIPEPAPGPGEVAAGVRLVTPTPAARTTSQDLLQQLKKVDPYG